MNTRDRRRVLLALGALALLPAAVRAAALRPTPANALGPFYPQRLPAEADADLAEFAGGRAAGRLLYVAGRVLDAQGRPLAGVRLELWQADAGGRYHHVADDGGAALDPHFQGYARLATDAEGRFGLRTVKPGAYPFGAGAQRTPHIHFIVDDGRARLVTQMFFEDEPLNARDPLYRRLGEARAAATSRPVPLPPGAERDALAVAWDIVLPG